jgi:hypothetical protein
MSNSQLALCSSILNDFYGKTVEKVAVSLARGGLSSIRAVLKKTGLSVKEVSDIWTLKVSLNIFTVSM